MGATPPPTHNNGRGHLIVIYIRKIAHGVATTGMQGGSARRPGLNCALAAKSTRSGIRLKLQATEGEDARTKSAVNKSTGFQ